MRIIPMTALVLGLLAATTSAYLAAAPPLSPNATERPSVTGFSLASVEYRFIGSWNAAATEFATVTRHTTVGGGQHFVEVRPNGGEWERYEVVESGEVFALGQRSLWLDWNETGNVQFQTGGTMVGVPPLLLRDDCDISGGISTAASWSLTGGCWGTLVINPDTGVWNRSCNLNNQKNCVMKFSDGANIINATFACGGSGQAGGNGNNTLWWSNACTVVSE